MVMKQEYIKDKIYKNSKKSIEYTRRNEYNKNITYHNMISRNLE